jgi:ribosome-binding protein aMBF1 (putative translation factor)
MKQGKKLIAGLISLHNLKNDAQLAHKLNVAPPVISKVRNGKLTIGDSLLIKIQRTFKMTLPEVEALYVEVDNGNF